MVADGRFALVKTTLLDYPGKVAAAVFLPGCHLRCPYCHNPEFVDPGDDGPFDSDIESFRSFVDRRASVLGGVVFSGGEALLSPLLPGLIDIARERNLAVKLDTAGLLPDRLESLLETGRLDYVAMDFKTLPERYAELGWHGKNAAALLRRTLALLAGSGLSYEIRTTVVPPLVTRDILRLMAPYLEGVPLWVWQPYAPGRTLDPGWSDLRAPDAEMLTQWSDSPGTDVRIMIR